MHTQTILIILKTLAIIFVFRGIVHFILQFFFLYTHIIGREKRRNFYIPISYIGREKRRNGGSCCQRRRKWRSTQSALPEFQTARCHWTSVFPIETPFLLIELRERWVLDVICMMKRKKWRSSENQRTDQNRHWALRRQWTRTLRPWTLTLRPMSKTLRSYSKTSRLQTDTLLATYSNRHYGHYLAVSYSNLSAYP